MFGRYGRGRKSKATRDFENSTMLESYKAGIKPLLAYLLQFVPKYAKSFLDEELPMLLSIYFDNVSADCKKNIEMLQRMKKM